MGETDQRPPLVVCDAGPLIHLDELACFDLLADFPNVLVPEEVWREVQRHRPGVLGQFVVTLSQLSPTQPVPPTLGAMALGVRQIRRYHREPSELFVPEQPFTATYTIGKR